MMCGMANRQRLLSIGAQRGDRMTVAYGEAVGEARRGLGLTLKQLSEIVGISPSQLWRVERAEPPHPDFIRASRIAQVLGLDLSVKLFPTGAAVRDIAHVRLIERFREATPAVRWSLEDPVPLPRDLRAWDALARVEEARIGVAAETRLRDEQSLLRREHAKMRDSDVDRLILLVWATRTNRATLHAIRDSLRAALPLDTREVLASLRAGRDPGQSGIVLL